MIKPPSRYKFDPYKRGITDQKTGQLVCNESSVEEYFAKKTNTTKKNVERLDGLIEKLVAEREQAREKCRHNNTVHRFFSDTGNYDPTQDCYWIEFRCYDCGKVWTEDQK